MHNGYLGKEFNDKLYEVHKKLPLLSIFGNASNYHPNLSPVYTYFKDLEVNNVTNQRLVSNLSDIIKSDLQKEDYKWLELQLERLIRACDTQINSLKIDKKSKIRNFEHNKEEKIITVSRNEILFGQHKIYVDQKDTGDLYTQQKLVLG